MTTHGDPSRAIAQTAQRGDPVAVAVSGGPDSMALLHLAAQGARKSGAQVIAATVDHGLRPDSAAEARWVAARCGALGVAHETLHWTGDKPATGLPAAARQARYALLAQWARAHGADRILVGHTMDDQAETVAFRIASGAGARGAAGLRPLSVCPIWPEGRGVLLVRPLLSHRRTDLQKMLRDADADWLNDPTNDDPHYARPRMRARLAAMSEHAPGLIPRLAALGAKLSAAQMEDERAALALLQEHLRFDAFGAGLLDFTALRAAERETAALALSLAILAASGEAHAPALADIAHVWDRLTTKVCAITMGGARVGRLGRAHDHALLITRDPGAASGRADAPPPPDLTLVAGQTSVFDGRFELSASPALPGPVVAKALGPSARRGLYPSESMKAALIKAPAHARPGLPQILFKDDGADATLPRFMINRLANASENADSPWILARFLGDDRLAAMRAALSGEAGASF